MLYFTFKYKKYHLFYKKNKLKKVKNTGKKFYEKMKSRSLKINIKG